MKKKRGMGYILTVLFLLIFFPAISILWDHSAPGGFGAALGKWFVFWVAGVRLFLAGLSQIFRPAFTAEKIFKLKDKRSYVIVRELGFSNTCIGLAGILSLFLSSWCQPVAFIGGLYYGLAGLLHLFKKANSLNEKVALVTDFYAFAVFAAYGLISWVF